MNEFCRSIITDNIVNIDFQKDIEAITKWLCGRANRSENTFDSYKRQAEKLLNWALQKNLNLTQFTLESANEYLDYLSDSGIKPKSLRYSRTVLTQMFSYLCDLGYLNRNVFNLTPPPLVIEEDVPIRYLDIDAWIWLWNWLTTRPVKTQEEKIKARDRWLFALIYYTGIRRSEVASGKMSDFMYKSNRWVLKVVGKRKKVRFVSINTILLQELKRYRISLGLNELPSSKEQFGLIIQLKGNKERQLTARAIGLMVYNVREQVIADCEIDHISMQIKEMSTHWMRHTNITHSYMAGASMETIQDEKGHADPKTTRIYLKTQAEARQRDSEKLAELNINAIYKNI